MRTDRRMRRAHAQGAPQQQRRVARVDRRPPLQRGVVHRLDLVEDAQPALHDQPQLPAGAPGDGGATSGAPAQHQLARPADQLGDQRAQRRRCPALRAGGRRRRRGARSRPAARRARPRAMSTPRSCQKLISCNALQIASDCAQRARVVDCRTGAAAGGRPGWPSAGSSRAARRGRRSACLGTSCSKASADRRAGRRQRVRVDDRRRSGPKTSRPARRRLRRPRRPRAGRRGRLPGRPAAAAAGASPSSAMSSAVRAKW